MPGDWTRDEVMREIGAMITEGKDSVALDMSGAACPNVEQAAAWAEAKGFRTEIRNAHDTLVIYARPAASRDVPMDTIENDAYLLKCACPACGHRMPRGYGAYEQYCPACGQKIRMPDFAQAEIDAACFERQCDEYCT